jgi:hypothetical protein
MDSKPDSKLDTVLKVTRLALQVTAIFGIMVGFTVARDWRRNLYEEQRINRLAHANDMHTFAAEYMKLSDDTADFLKLLPPDCGKDPACLPDPKKLFDDSGGIGRDMYFSPALTRFREIGNSYEVLGALVRKGYVDFDFVYTLVFFPDDFWTRTREYRRLIQTRWDLDPQAKATDCAKTPRPQTCYEAMPDFWGNFSWLRDEFLKERRKTSQ